MSRKLPSEEEAPQNRDGDSHVDNPSVLPALVDAVPIVQLALVDAVVPSASVSLSWEQPSETKTIKHENKMSVSQVQAPITFNGTNKT